MTENRENVNNAAAVDGGVNNETLADIVAEMRDEMTGTHYVADGMIESLHRAQSELRALADRIEAAWKREKAVTEADALAVGGIVEAERHKPGNAAAMREALERCADIINKFSLAEIINTPMEVICDIQGIINAALAAPPQNCDVGTPDEQGERCLAQFDQWRREGDGRKLITAIMAWAQMPYNEEGGAQ